MDSKNLSNPSNANRSVLIRFVNQTDAILTRETFDLSHGIWSGDQVPAEQIWGGTNAQWQSESDGFMTGTEGYVQYYIGYSTDQVVKVTWDNPFAGGNSYSGNAPDGYSITHTGGDGDNATVTFTFANK